MKNCLLFIVFSLLWNRSMSTCIVILKTRDAIYVAADSKSVGVKYDGKTVSDYVLSINKIHNVGDTYFAISGHDDVALFHTAESLLKKNLAPQEFIFQYRNAMVNHYRNTMPLERKVNAKNYKYYLKVGLARVSFFRFYNGLPMCADVLFRITEDAKGTQTVESMFDPWDNRAFTILGYSDHILKKNNSQLSYSEIDKNHIERYLENMVLLEMKYHKRYIGKPIVLLKLTKDKAIWIRKNPNAQSI